MDNSKSSSKSSVLIVDDNMANLQVLGNILRESGYKVIAARNGLEALRFAAKTPPDLILLDIMMPELGGFETCGKLKENEETKDIPIIFITALTDTADKLRAFREGGVDYITKPFTAEEVLARVKVNVERKLYLEEIKNHEANLNALIENTSDLIWSVNKKYIITVANSLLERTTQIVLGVEMKPGANFIEVIPKIHRKRWKEYFDCALAGINFTIEEHFKLKGKPILLEISLNPIRCVDDIIGVSCFGRNNVTRKQIQNEFLKFQSLIDTLNVGAAIANTDGVITFVNPTFAKIHGYEVEELIGKSLSIFYSTEQLEELDRQFKKLFEAGSMKNTEVFHLKKDGSILHSSVDFVMFKNDMGEPQFITITVLGTTNEG